MHISDDHQVHQWLRAWTFTKREMAETDIFSFYLGDCFGSLTFILGCVAGGLDFQSRSNDYGLDLYSMGEMAGAWTFILRI